MTTRNKLGTTEQGKTEGDSRYINELDWTWLRELRERRKKKNLA